MLSIKIKWKRYTTLFLLMHSCYLTAQLAEIESSQTNTAPDFYYDIISTASEDSGKSVLKLYTKITYDELQFLKIDDQYRAQYELSVTVINPAGEQADNQILKKETYVNNYDQTNSQNDFSISEVSFILRPATYELIIGMMDLDSRETGRRKTSFIVRDYEVSPLMVSDILLADQIKADSLGQLIPVANVMGNYGESQDTLFLWFEVYNRLNFDSILVAYNIFKSDQDIISSNSFYKPLTGKNSLLIIEILRDELESGRYRFELVIGEGEEQKKQIRDLTVRWMGMPVYANDLDKAIEQMQYLMRGNELKKMKEKDGEEKVRFFREFWKSLDPTPATIENELMEEYYQRVDFTNANYGTHNKGWKTDRGMVYIILGPPNDIERHPFAVDTKPYEIWSYYRINREFVFMDETGFGEYRLISPFWEVLNKIR